MFDDIERVGEGREGNESGWRSCAQQKTQNLLRAVEKSIEQFFAANIVEFFQQYCMFSIVEH